MMPRWYFDFASQMCLEFIYGGCGGNSNNFATKELCEQQCGSRDVQIEEGNISVESSFIVFNCG